MPQVHAPYHFVPLSKWVYMPDWAHLVSHDVPFKDGYSGVVDYRLTNATPLLVGGEQERVTGQPALVKWVRDPQGNPVIPGTSIKGMLRNVLEIASFGKFAAIDDRHFSFRDISSKSHYLENVIKPNKVSAAWLKYNPDAKAWELSTCQWAKVKHALIRSSLNQTIVNDSTAVEKYEKLPLDQHINVNIETREVKNQGMVNFVTRLGQGNTTAHFVFCNTRILGKGAAQDYEFSYCFFGEPQKQPISAEELNNKVNLFFRAHSEAPASEQIEYLKTNGHRELGMPVFALFSGKKLHSIGLARMPRVLYSHSVTELADRQQPGKRSSDAIFDLAELMFGTLREKGLGLKSRVFFSDASLTKNTGLVNSSRVTLNSPKATFLGAYVEQPVDKTYQDYNQSGAKLSGWKRYLANTAFRENTPDKGHDNVDSTLELMRPNAEFTGKIAFHNLKAEELGALLWCLQLGEFDPKATQHKRFHSLGHGKSLGAGSVRFSIKFDQLSGNLRQSTLPSAPELMSRFSSMMNQLYSAEKNVSWEKSPQIQHLLAMATPFYTTKRDLTYNKLGEFQPIKNEKGSLPKIQQGDATLGRNETPFLLDNAPLSFTRGRLAGLFDAENGNHKELRRKQQERINKIRFDAEEALKEAQKKEQESQLEHLPEPLKNIIIALDKAKNIDEKRAQNVEIEKYLQLALDTEQPLEAVKQFIEMVEDKNRCEYLNVKDNKKLRPRKEAIAQLKQKYGLS